MNSLYEKTALTPLRVAQESGFLDWSSQPSIFKHYPHFLFSYSFGEIEALHAIELARMVSSAKEIGSKQYYQLTTPSAGNLHPVEFYVQIRGLKGVLSGIYHVDAGKSQIVLIKEVQDDGLESFVGLNGSLNGMLFIITTVPFRSQWKYKSRAIRYCYLDVGHQIGALSSSLKLSQQKMTILSECDTTILNQKMGFKEEEFVAALGYCGELREKSIKPLKEDLMHVMPTDYSEMDNLLVNDIKKCDLFKHKDTKITAQIDLDKILQRRSARFFDTEISMQKEQLKFFMQEIQEIDDSLSCYLILLKDIYLQAGIYNQDKLLKEGNFTQKICSLLVDQRFIKNADMVFVITSKEFSENKLMQAGVFVHNLYMLAQSEALGCSGVGAFYDKKMQSFLQTQEYILYVSVVGVNKK